MMYSGKYIRTLLAVLALILVLSGIDCAVTERTFAAAVKKPAKVKISSVKASRLKITVKWKKAKNAKKYQVYQKTGSGKWKLRKTLKKRLLTVRGAYGKTYRFKVRGVNGKKKGRFSAIRKISIPKKNVDPEKPKDPEEETEAQKAGKAAAAKIAELPEIADITLDDKAAIAAAKQAYDGLTDEAKAYVAPNAAERLERAEARIVELEREQAEKEAADKAAANAVSARIIGFYVNTYEKGKMTVYDVDSLKEIRDEYNALTDAQKAYIDQEATLSCLDEMEANLVSMIIIDFYANKYEKGLMTVADKNKLASAREKYDALTDAHRTYIDTEALSAKLQEMETRMAELIIEQEEREKLQFVSWPTVTIGGLKYYTVTESEGKTLLLACDVIRDSAGEPVKMRFGDTAVWRDSDVRAYLRDEYLPVHPELDGIALTTDIKTLGSVDEEGNRYITTEDKLFIMTLADIAGASGYYTDPRQEEDFTYNGAVLPGLENNQAIMKEKIVFWARNQKIAGTVTRVPGIELVSNYLGKYMSWNDYVMPSSKEFSILPAFWAYTEALPQLDVE